MRGWKSGFSAAGIAALMVLSGRPAVIWAATTSAPLPGGGNTFMAMVKIFLSLIVVTVLVVLTIRYLASKSQVQQRGAISVLAARQVAPNRSVQVIEVGGQRYLIGVGEQVTMLADVTDQYALDDEVADEDRRSVFAGIFSDALSTVRSRYRDAESKEGTK